jgi:hypothetical protein
MIVNSWTRKDRGTRSWVLHFQNEGRRRDFGLGSARDVSLANARDEDGKPFKEESARYMWKFVTLEPEPPLSC